MGGWGWGLTQQSVFKFKFFRDFVYVGNPFWTYFSRIRVYRNHFFDLKAARYFNTMFAGHQIELTGFPIGPTCIPIETDFLIGKPVCKIDFSGKDTFGTP